MPLPNEFFGFAMEDVLGGEPARAASVTEQLAALQMQQRKLIQIANVAQSLGQDVSVLQPMADFLRQRQRSLIEQIAMRSMVPGSATQVQPQVPAPRLP